MHGKSKRGLSRQMEEDCGLLIGSSLVLLDYEESPWAGVLETVLR